jgi:hypothetical protein
MPPPASRYAAAIDPELGRIAVPPAAGASPKVDVSYYYGFNAGMGGGEYPRESSFIVQNQAWVLPFPDTASTQRYSTLQGALDYAVAQLSQTSQIAVEIRSSARFAAPGIKLDLPPGATIELRAAESCRPTLVLAGEIAVTGADRSGFTMNGFLICSDQAPANATSALVHAPSTSPSGSANRLGGLTLAHCTLVPGWAVTPSGDALHPGQPVLVAEADGLQVTVWKSILGAIRAEELVSVSLADSAIDSNARTHVAYAAPDGVSAGGALTLVSCTVVGKVHATLLDLVSNSIIWAGLVAGDTFKAGLWSDRRQAGCVRFSFLPSTSILPRPFACVEQGPDVPQPLFYSLRYGDPAYAKLLPDTDDAIRRGADDGGEMGVFHFVQAPLREADLRIRLQEYLPAGLEFAVLYQN